MTCVSRVPALQSVATRCTRNGEEMGKLNSPPTSRAPAHRPARVTRPDAGVGKNCGDPSVVSYLPQLIQSSHRNAWHAGCAPRRPWARQQRQQSMTAFGSISAVVRHSKSKNDTRFRRRRDPARCIRLHANGGRNGSAEPDSAARSPLPPSQKCPSTSLVRRRAGASGDPGRA
jgi:hypothetical protein